MSSCSYSSDELGKIDDICGGILLALQKRTLELVHCASVVADDTTMDDSIVVLGVGKEFGEIGPADFVNSSVAVMIETLDVDEAVVDVGEEGAEGDEADGVPGRITISGNDSIDDFKDWLSRCIFSDDNACSVINDREEILSMLSFWFCVATVS